MAFNGYLIMVGKNKETAPLGTVLPLNFMRYETYQITADQSMDYNSTRGSDGQLHRAVLGHTSTKIEFNTPRLSNAEFQKMMNIFKKYWNNPRERRLGLYYFDPMTGGYNKGDFYMPDINLTISNIDSNTGKIMYTETRIAFIEY